MGMLTAEYEAFVPEEDEEEDSYEDQGPSRRTSHPRGGMGGRRWR